jgi:hypothetical protein
MVVFLFVELMKIFKDCPRQKTQLIYLLFAPHFRMEYFTSINVKISRPNFHSKAWNCNPLFDFEEKDCKNL